VGVSTHNVEQLEAAALAPVDYVAVGPIYQTPTKARPDPVVGLDLVRQARQLVTVPLVAIGGITRESA
jgi:thiamine-phosphate pyrophosphorylase